MVSRTGWKFSVWIIRTAWRLPVIRQFILRTAKSAIYGATVREALQQVRRPTDTVQRDSDSERVDIPVAVE